MLVRRVRLDEVLGQAGQRRRTVHVDVANVLDDVLLERLAELGQLLVDGPEPRARGLVAIDAGAAEVAQRVLDQAPRLGIERVRVERGKGLVEPAIEPQRGHERVDVLLAHAGGLADCLVGMHGRDETGHAGRVLGVHHHLVVRLEGVGSGARAGPVQELRQQRPGAFQALAAARCEGAHVSGRDLAIGHDGFLWLVTRGARSADFLSQSPRRRRDRGGTHTRGDRAPRDHMPPNAASGISIGWRCSLAIRVAL